MLQSCGLDAFMHVKMLTYGVQLFTPIAFFGLVMCELQSIAQYSAAQRSTVYSTDISA